MTTFFNHLRDFFYNFNGILLPKERTLDEELNEVYFNVYGFDERLGPYNDRANIKKDIFNVRKDFRKSIKEYKRTKLEKEAVHG